MLIKKLFFLIGDAFLLTVSIYGAYVLRFDGHVPPGLWAEIPIVAATSVLLKLAVFFRQRLHMLSWSQVGLEDMVLVFRGVTLATAVFWIAALGLRYVAHWLVIPRSVLLIDYVLTLNMIGAFRLARRVERYLRRYGGEGRVTLIVGAGASGEQLLMSLQNTGASGYIPIGFVDDDPTKIGTTIRGLRVLGRSLQLLDLVRTYKVEAILIAMPSASSSVIRNIVSLARQGNVREIRIVPTFDRILNGDIRFNDLREIELADLLGRQPVRLETAAIDEWLRGRVVLVTGAGGSIGSELCRQMTRFGPREIVLLDCDETALFWIEQELRRLRQRAQACLEDVRNRDRMAKVMRRVRPDVIFHAAAHKHVDLMERHPDHAVSANVLGTAVVAQVARETGVEKFVLVSTDKAVNPTGVMGATKHVAEQICLAMNGRGPTRYLAVRFGNVLGSRGSVLPLFQDNIRRGDAITVRGRETRRYFMAISEAVLLVLEAAAVGNGGEVFVLDMGDPIRIIDLACELIRLSGLEPYRDVPIVFADLLPGEKEHEELLSAEDGLITTSHDRILMVRPAALDEEALSSRVATLCALADTGDHTGIIHTLMSLVPTYQPSAAGGGDTQIAVVQAVESPSDETPKAGQPRALPDLSHA